MSEAPSGTLGVRVALRARLRIGLLGAFASFCLLAADSAGPAERPNVARPHADPCAASDPQDLRERAREYRLAHGLPASHEFLDYTLNDRSLAASATRHGGVPLVPEEEAEVREARSVIPHLRLIERYGVERAGDSYAGYEVDFTNGGTVYVGFARNAARHFAALRRIFPQREKLRLFRARWPREELDALLDRAVADERLRNAGVDIREAGVSIRKNRVEVFVASPAAHARRLLRRRYGPAFSVTGIGLTSREFQPPAVELVSLGVRARGVPMFCGHREVCPAVRPPPARPVLPVRPGSRVVIRVHAQARSLTVRRLTDEGLGPRQLVERLDRRGRVWAFRVACREPHRRRVGTEIYYRGGVGTLDFHITDPGPPK